MTLQEIAATAASIGLFIAYIPYFWGMYQGKTKPHAFSWVIWALVASIASAVQLIERGGAGAWLMTVMAAIRWTIAVVAFKTGDHSATKGDWISFLAGLVVIPIWVLTKNPLYSVVLVSVIETMGYYSTIRQSWFNPWVEVARMYLLSSINTVLIISALSVHTAVTMLQPITGASVNLLFVGLLLYRRRVLRLASRDIRNP